MKILLVLTTIFLIGCGSDDDAAENNKKSIVLGK